MSDGLDAAELSARVRDAVRRQRPGVDVEVDGGLEPLPGGISSLTFAAALSGGERVVVKVAPPGLEPVRNRDVLRQARVLRALAGVPGVRVPRVLAEDPGTPPLFVMEFVAGEAYEPRWDAPAAVPEPEIVAARARAAARMLAALQKVDPLRLDLQGEPVLSPAEELERWRRLFATVGDELRGDEASLADALAARVPALGQTRILHGDYRLGNMQCTGAKVAAVIDWEIWSLGDPRHDLAWLMLFADPVMEREAVDEAAAAAMPSADELLRDHMDAAALTAPPADLDWFRALAAYKLGATMAVLAKRNRRRPEPDPGLERAAQTTPALLERARALLWYG